MKTEVRRQNSEVRMIKVTSRVALTLLDSEFCLLTPSPK